MKRIIAASLCFLWLGTIGARHADAHVYVFAGESNGIELVTHSMGYTGAGGVLNITVGVDNTSAFAAQMVYPTQQVVNVWNGLDPTTQNLDFPAELSGKVDFESTLLHEMGHALGLGHPNLASESGLSDPQANATKSTDGANNVFDVVPGSDGVFGSPDDVRGDDVNLHWFHRASNDPFAVANALGVVDVTTYSVRTANLPGADDFAANADRSVANLPRYTQPNTEAVMQQGAYYGEAQRTLGADDVSGMKYAMAGLDELAATADDYTVNLIFNGLVASNDPGTDIIIDFDDAQASFAVTYVTGMFISDGLPGPSDEVLLDAEGNVVAGESYRAEILSASEFDVLVGSGLGGEPLGDDLSGGQDDQTLPHAVVTSAPIYFNTNYPWFFTVPEPGSVALLGIGLLAVGLWTYRRRRAAE